MLIFGHDEAVAYWAAQRLDVADFGPCAAIGIARKGKLVAAAVYYRYSGPNIEFAFASSTPRWATKETISAVFRYPFVQLGCRRMTALTHEANSKAQEAMTRLGFVKEGYHPDAFADGAGISFGLLRAAAEKWIGE